MADLQGHSEPRFDAVREALQRNIDSGAELDASLVVDVDGERVVDVRGGFRDAARTTPWDEHTITNVWSSTKTVTSLAALMLVERGELDVYAPVARYWRVHGVDLVLGVPLRWGIGYGLPERETVRWIPDGRICFWGGWGGSVIIMDLDRRMTISYMMNLMGPGIIGSDRSAEYTQAIYGVVG